MPDPLLERRSARAGFAKRGRMGQPSGVAGVVVEVIENFTAATIVAGKNQSGETIEWLSGLFEAPVSDGPRRLARGTLSICGVAPGQWLAIERDASQATLAMLRTSLAPLAAVVDQSDSCLVLEVTGPMAISALAKGIPVDLHSSAFKPGDVARTIAAHIGVQISSMTERPAFELITAASTARSLWNWLTASAGEYGLDVV